MVKWIKLGLLVLMSSFAFGQIVINEVDADQAGTDGAEFIELFGPPNTSLTGYTLVLFNGSDDASYLAFDLDGQSLDGTGFFVLCGNAANVANCDMDVSPDSNLIQNGAEAVALYLDDAANFPEDTAITTTNLIDAVVHASGESDDAGLLSGLTPGQPQINESANGSSTTDAIARSPDGGTALVTGTYVTQPPTPGVSNGGSVTIVINEIDTSTPSETGDFIELFGTPGASLSGFVLVLYDGATDTSTAAFDLDGSSIGNDGFFVLCGNGGVVPNCDFDASTADLFGTGPRGAALYMGDDTDFPNGTAVTSANIVDAIVYDTGQADDAGLIGVLTPNGSQIDESTGGLASSRSISRNPDGGMVLDTSTYQLLPPTPGSSNPAGPTSDVVINEFVSNHAGMDAFEFIEIFGAASTDYSHLDVVVLQGSAADNPGNIHAVVSVGMTDANGIWFSGFNADLLTNDALTFLLVEGYTPPMDLDLDDNNDGTLEETPWTTILDAIAISEQNPGDFVYAQPVLLPNFDGDIFMPGGASRIPNGTDTNGTGDWDRNNFGGAGLPGLSGTLSGNEAANTPGDVNSTVQPPDGLNAVINEWVTDHIGNDTNEYIELLGDPLRDYSGLTLILLDGTNNPGEVIDIIQPGITDVGGYWLGGFYNNRFDNNNSYSLLLVENWSGSMNLDLDTNDDGNLDGHPWWRVVDTVAIGRGVSATTYGSTVIMDLLEGLGGSVAAGFSRIPNGTDTDSVGDWKRNDFDGEGIPGFTGSVTGAEVQNTPGTFNITQPSGGTNALINEFVFNHTGGDEYEFIEISGTAMVNYTNLSLLVIEGDSAQNPGLVQAVYQVGETNAGGYWFTGYLDNVLENNTQTILLVEGLSGGSPGTDLDSNDDGTLDSMPWTSIIDDVGVSDGDAGDFVYSSVNLAANFDGNFFTPGGASRIPDNTDTNATSDWKRNDFEGAGLPNLTGNLDTPLEANNTAGAANTDSVENATNAIISEFVADHVGFDDFEYVEIFGDPGTPYLSSSIVVLDGDSEGNPGLVEAIYPLGTTDSDGFYVTAFKMDEISNGSKTFLLAVEFTGAVNDDLDTNDDGSLDVIPFTSQSDNVAVSDGGAGDMFYSFTILSPHISPNKSLQGTSAIGGASRYPYFMDTNMAADWIENDFDGAGLHEQGAGFTRFALFGTAYNTPGRVTRLSQDEYYTNVDTSDMTTARTTIHATIEDHVYFPYTSFLTDTWDVLEMADQDTGNSGNIISIYKNATYPKQGGGNAFYNREHTWAKSFGFPDDDDNAYPYTDFHHLRLADSGYNSNRSNIAYGTCNGGCTEDPSDANNGVGGGTGVYPGNSNWRQGSGGTGIYEVWQHRRGDIARSLLYMDVRYEGGNHARTTAFEPDLILTDNTALINTTGVNTSGLAYIGRLTTLLQWHEDDPVDEEEMNRNEIIYQFQGNRNPFVDHPEWVDCVFNGNCPVELTSCVLGAIGDWRQAPPLCPTGDLSSIQDLVSLINGTCGGCP